MRVQGKTRPRDMYGLQIRLLNREADTHKVILHQLIVSQNPAKNILTQGPNHQGLKIVTGRIQTAGLQVHHQQPEEGTIHHQILPGSIHHRPIIKTGRTLLQEVTLHQVTHLRPDLLRQATQHLHVPHHPVIRHHRDQGAVQDHLVVAVVVEDTGKIIMKYL
jgi:hypothetical protein